MKSIVVLGAILGTLVLSGCGQQQGATPLNTVSASAPPPADLTPDQKKAYEEAQRTGPTASAAGK